MSLRRDHDDDEHDARVGGPQWLRHRRQRFVRIIFRCYVIAMLGLLVGLGIVGVARSAELVHAVPATVLRVYDGDTFTVDAAIWPGHTVRISVRVRGIDTPEIRGRCDAEKELAVEARDAAKEILGSEVFLLWPELGKFAGRVVASVITLEDVDLAQELIRLGLARPYDGRGRREGWCE